MSDLETDLRASEDEKIYCETCMEEASELFTIGSEQISVCSVCKGMEESWQKEQEQKPNEHDDGWHDLREKPDDMPEERCRVWLIAHFAHGWPIEATSIQSVFWSEGFWIYDNADDPRRYNSLEPGSSPIAWMLREQPPAIPDRFKKEKV